MKVQYVQDGIDINTHSVGDLAYPTGAARASVLVVERGNVLALNAPTQGLVVLLEPAASLSVPDEVLAQCEDLFVFQCVLKKRGQERAEVLVVSEPTAKVPPAPPQPSAAPKPRPKKAPVKKAPAKKAPKKRAKAGAK